MATPLKHAELIKAWADGAEIQFLRNSGKWETITNPVWHPEADYRVKPTPPHKWQHLIDAQAAGKICQMIILGTWQDGTWEFNNKDAQYRLKPPTLKFRNFLRRYQTVLRDRTQVHVCVCSWEENQQEDRTKWVSFIQWIGDWQEVEILAP